MKRIAKLPAVVVLFASSVGCGSTPDGIRMGATAARPSGRAEGPVNASRPELTVQVRHPWDCGAGVRVRLDADRLRAYNLSRDDVVKALTPSGIVDPSEPLPPPGVVFTKHLFTPDQYENVILSADPEGNVVRLKDVGEVDAEPGAAADGGAR